MSEQNELQLLGVMSKGYGIMPKMVALDDKLSIEAKAIYALLTSFSGAGNSAFPAIDTITHYLNISERRFLKYRKELIDNGYVTVNHRYVNGKRTSNVYILNMEILHCQNVSVENVSIENVSVDFDGSNNNNLNNNSINNNNSNLKKKKEKETNFDIAIKEYTTNEDLKITIYDFIKMRKAIKKPLTDKAFNLLLKELDKLASTESEKIEILNKSIVNCWRGVFPLKQGGQKTNGKNGSNENSSTFAGYDLEIN